MKQIFLGLLTGLFFTGLLESIVYLKLKNFWNNPKTYFGYHVHHSVLGLACIILGSTFIKNQSRMPYFLIGLGLGIIIVHTITDGRLIFIERGDRQRVK